MPDEFDVSDPFSISSPVVFDVPPQTAQSNVTTQDRTKEYSIRPDKQIFLNAYFGFGTVPFTYHNTKNFVITKIYYMYDMITAFVVPCVLRIYRVNSATSDPEPNIHLGFLTVDDTDPTLTGAFYQGLRQLDFHHPYYFDTKNDTFYLQIDLLGEGVHDTVDVYVMGYEVD